MIDRYHFFILNLVFDQKWFEIPMNEWYKSFLNDL